MFLKYKDHYYQVDLTRNQIGPTTDIRVAELMKESKTLPLITKELQSNYPVITKEDVTLGRNITGPTFLLTDDEHSHVLNAVEIDLPPSDRKIDSQIKKCKISFTQKRNPSPYKSCVMHKNKTTF